MVAPPERIDIAIIADGKPVPGALVDVSLSMKSKNPHTMVLGPADENGRILVMRAELVERAMRNCRHFVMDYADITKYFGGTVEVRPVTPERVRQIRKGYEEFSPYFDYPADWPTVLKAAEQWFAEHRVSSLTARVEVVPSSVQVNALEAVL